MRRSSLKQLLSLALVAGLVVASGSVALRAQQDVYPGASWEQVASPESAGWSGEKLRLARDYSKTIKTAAVMVVQGGRVIDQWGETATKFNIHSIRKSLLSAMYGIHVADGRIDPSTSSSEPSPVRSGWRTTASRTASTYRGGTRSTRPTRSA